MSNQPRPSAKAILREGRVALGLPLRKPPMTAAQRAEKRALKDAAKWLIEELDAQQEARARSQPWMLTGRERRQVVPRRRTTPAER